MVVAARASRLSRHHLDESRRVAASGEVVRAHVELPQVFLGQVHAAGPRIDLHVAQDVGELQRDAEVHCVVPRARVAVAEDLDAASPTADATR